ncbi:MAG TPA: ribosome biogenesis GTPase Der [Longimicrobiaceae bacterium]|nr:ribosome biogenesis GTPase Der [Longimicrobiaceae bacterium]
MKLPVVAVVGRPNVGKSTFFNRVLGRRLAIVEDRPGVTRDRNFARADWNGRQFYVVDTGGMVQDSDEAMDRLIRQQVIVAIEEADVVVQMVDGRTGPHPLDYRIAEYLRRADRPIVLLVNKVDNLGSPTSLEHHEFWDLGVGEPLPVSSLSGKGSGDVLDAIVDRLPAGGDDAEDEALRVAVIGKPNVGKSSLVNRLLGAERLVVSETAGTTRDAIDTPMEYKGKTLIFVDTAGLRRQARVHENVEYYSVIRTERAIERADVCLLLIDATEPIHHQDLRIAQKAWDAGCGLILVVNKWDLVEKETMTAPRFEKAVRQKAPFLEWVPIIFISALSGQRAQKTLDLVLSVQAARERRVPTHEVNEVVRDLASRSRPPHQQGRPVKVLYGTQVSVAPPTFVLWANYPEAIPENYLRYLQNGFRRAWEFTGAPLRIILRRRHEEE